MKNRIRITLLLMCALAVPSAARADAQSRGDSLKIDRLVFDVTLDDGNTYAMVGYLYYHGSVENRTLQVLLHGTSYDHRYWDVPSINGSDYSYARYMAAQKYAVLALDLLGSGESSRPPGDFLNLAETALGVHQVVVAMRTGANLTGESFQRIVLVGHSYGSIDAIYVQATWHDADALVDTGWQHTIHSLGIDPSAFLPLLATPYITVPNTVRDFLLFYAPQMDPSVVEYDNANLVTTLSRGQFSDLFVLLFINPLMSRVAQVTGPVYIQLGDQDLVAPAAYAASEPSFYAGTTDVTVETLTEIGHAYNEHIDHLQSWIGIDSWISQRLSK